MDHAAKARVGTALCRSVAPPHRGAVKTSSAKARNSRKDVVTFSQEELQGDPGVYSITVVSSAGVESDYTLDIQQASVSGAAQQLHKEDAAALKKVGAQHYSPRKCMMMSGVVPAVHKGLICLAPVRSRAGSRDTSLRPPDVVSVSILYTAGDMHYYGIGTSPAGSYHAYLKE